MSLSSVTPARKLGDYTVHPLHRTRAVHRRHRLGFDEHDPTCV